MENKFDLKKFLVENKLTANSRTLKENTSREALLYKLESILQDYFLINPDKKRQYFGDIGEDDFTDAPFMTVADRLHIDMIDVLDEEAYKKELLQKISEFEQQNKIKFSIEKTQDGLTLT